MTTTTTNSHDGNAGGLRDRTNLFCLALRRICPFAKCTEYI